MTLTSAIMFSALRESNILGRTATATAGQLTEALARLNALVSSTYGYEVGRKLIDWPVGQEGLSSQDRTSWSAESWAYPPNNVRLIAASADAQTIYLHPHPRDGARIAIVDSANRLTAAPITIDGNGRTIENAASQAQSVNGAAKTWFYRADQGNWTLLSTLTGTDPEEFPFPPEFDDYFITMLAARLNPRYGRSLSEESVTALARSLDILRSRYTQAEEPMPERGAVALTRQYGAGRGSFNGDTAARNSRRRQRPPHYEG
jgi:hypothetical protein